MFSQDPRDTTTDPEALEQVNRDRLAGWFDLLGRAPSYPAGTDTVVALLRAVEYDVDPDWVLAALSNNWIPPVPREGGRLSWDATAVITLACAAEARRKWLPLSQMHQHKLTPAERITQIAESEGVEAWDDLDRYDFDGLLAMLVQVSRDSSAVEVLAAALREKLKRENVL